VIGPISLIAPVNRLNPTKTGKKIWRINFTVKEVDIQSLVYWVFSREDTQLFFLIKII